MASVKVSSASPVHGHALLPRTDMDVPDIPPPYQYPSHTQRNCGDETNKTHVNNSFTTTHPTELRLKAMPAFLPPGPKTPLMKSPMQNGLISPFIALSSPMYPSPLTPPSTPNIPSSPSPVEFAKSPRQTEPKPSTAASILLNHDLHPIFAAEYVLGEELGSGGFGFVVSAIRVADQQEVAVKFIFKDKVPYNGWAKDSELGLIPTEIYVLRHVRHPGIVNYLGTYQDHKFFYLVMELHGTPWSNSIPRLNGSDTSSLTQLANATSNQLQVPGQGLIPSSSSNLGSTSSFSSSSSSFSSSTSSIQPAVATPTTPSPRSLLVRRTSCDLFECIEHHSKFAEDHARMIFKQIVQVVYYLDGKGVCHRDIKDENIVIDKNFRVKLIDFGSAVILPREKKDGVSRNAPRYFDRFYGTISFASPEILLGETYRAEPAEIWALGILLYTILYGEVPFNDPIQAISGCFIQPKIKSSDSCLDLLNRMLTKDPMKRATIKEVVEHPWLH